MDLASQSLNPLIANLLEKKYLESFSSSDEFQIGVRKRTNYNCNNSNKIVENIPCHSANLRNKPILTRNQDKMLLINQYETDESTCCKHHCHSDKSYSRYVSLLNLYIRLQENGIKKSANMYHGVFSNSFIAIIIGELRAWMIKRGPILPQIYILLWLNSPILIQYITKELT